MLFRRALGARRPSEYAITILELPSLKLVQETTPPGYLIGMHYNRVYMAFYANAKYELVIFDRQLKELGRIHIPPVENRSTGCSPPMSIEQYDNDSAVLVANCGEIHVIDLKSFSILHSIPRYANYYSVALYDRLIFTTAVDQHSPIIVFDMDTGKEVARLPVYVSEIAIKGNVLLTAGKPGLTGRNANWPMETYRINATAIRNGAWQEARIVQQCRQAEALLADDTKDIYGAISMCEEAGIQGYAEDPTIPEVVFPAFRQYGLWLGQTLDRFSDAIRILEKAQAAKADPEVARALVEARLKAKVISSAGIGDITEAELQTDFGQALKNGNQFAKAITIAKTITPVGTSSRFFHFSDDKLYVGRNGCGTKECNGGAYIDVFDRSTLNELGSVQVVPEDMEQQDEIISIATDDKYIYASTEYRFAKNGRPNFFVIDKTTLEITKRAYVKSRMDMLHIEGSKLMVCGCYSTENQACAILDPATLDLTGTPDNICVSNGSYGNSIVAIEDKPSNMGFVAATRDYLVATEILFNIRDLPGLHFEHGDSLF